MTGMPSSDPLDQATVTPTQIRTTLDDCKTARARLKAEYGEAMTEASLEYQLLQLLDSVIPLLASFLPK
jgi:hypothetical protein